jgi:hypothetical protein
VFKHFATARVIAPNVELDVHMCAGFIDALSERAEELRAIDEQPRRFGGGDGILIQLREELYSLSLSGGQLLQERLRSVRNLALFSRSRSIHLARCAELLPDEPVSAEDEIKNCADVRKENNGPDPGKRRGGRLVAQQDMRNGCPGDQISTRRKTSASESRPSVNASAIR